MSTPGIVSKKNGTRRCRQSATGWPALLFLLLVLFRGTCLARLGRRGGRGRGGGRRGGVGLEGRGHAVLHDRDRDDLAVLQLEDRHLGVLAVALGVELHLAGGARERDVEHLGRE